MELYFADLHIHIGFTDSGKPVKISAGKDLTLANILYSARFHKGLDMIAIIDAHVPEILDRIKRDLYAGIAVSLPGGGIRYEEITLILGSEIEIKEEGRNAFHLLSLMPSLEKMEELSRELNKGMKNISLSSQRYNRTARELQDLTKGLGGLFIPAHIFTPHKGILSAVTSLEEVLNLDQIDAVELGLSGDTTMADHLPELRQIPFLSNSDAHSLGKIAREYQMLQLSAPDFLSLAMALKGDGENRIIANYGLNPSLGKYHRSICAHCGLLVVPYQPKCPQCGNKIAKGVFDRVLELGEEKSLHPSWRPPYFWQIPLEYFPGVGRKTYLRLLEIFGNEINILHRVPIEKIREAFDERLADWIERSRKNQLDLIVGGGGTYGRIRI